MSRLTRLFVIASMLLAVAVEIRLAEPEWPALRWAAVLAFAAAGLAGRWLPRAVTAVVLAFGYLAPAIFTAAIGRFRLAYVVVWMAGLIGLCLAERPLRGWALPPRWKWPLATWALAVAAVWPVVALREVDFTLAVLDVRRIANTSVGVLPREAILAVVGAALTQGVGLLLFDWLHDRFRQAPGELLRRRVIWPLAAGALAACLLGTYQGFVNLRFLSGGNWPELGRAAGSMVDANAFGMIAALWACGFIALGIQARLRAGRGLAAAGSLLALTGLWASGSRSALIAVIGGAALIGAGAWRALPSRRSRTRLLAAIAAVVLLLAFAVALTPGRTSGPLRRFFTAIPAPGLDNVKGFAYALWHRNYYGAAAVLMIREHPAVGIGIGTFNMFSSDYTALAGNRAPPDNAQNWFRHQIAELGLVGSVGWILWVGLFVATLARTRGEGELRLPSLVIKGAIVGFGAISMLGVPAQSAAVTMTFWVFAFWYLRLVSPERHENGPVLPKRSEGAAWAAAVLLVAAHVGGTWAVAGRALSVPERAVRFGWNYTYGFYELERPAGATPFRWTTRRAVSVIRVEGKWLKLSVWGSHPDLAERPVAVRIWRDREPVLQLSLRDAAPVTRYVPVPEGQTRVILRVDVDRTWRPSDQGAADARELGIAVADWSFVERPSVPD
jgi:O-antigen ligase